jgi:hypothetical protein
MLMGSFGFATVSGQNPTKVSVHTCHSSRDVCQSDAAGVVDHETGHLVSLVLRFSVPAIFALALLLAYRLVRYWIFRWHLRHGSTVARVAASTLRALRNARSGAFPPAKHLWYTAFKENEPAQPFLCTACAGHITCAPSLNQYIQCCAACGAVAHEACLRHVGDTCRPFSSKEASHFWTVAGTCKRFDDMTNGDRIDRASSTFRRTGARGVTAPCLYCGEEAAGAAEYSDRPTWECACCGSLAHVSCFCDWHPGLTSVRSKYLLKLARVGKEPFHGAGKDGIGNSPQVECLAQDASRPKVRTDSDRDKDSDTNVNNKDNCTLGLVGKVVLPPTAVYMASERNEDTMLTARGSEKLSDEGQVGAGADRYVAPIVNGHHKSGALRGGAHDGDEQYGFNQHENLNPQTKKIERTSKRRGKRWLWKRAFAPLYRPIQRNDWRIRCPRTTEALEPVLVFINIKSGAQLGEETRRRLLRILHPLQVVALPREDPVAALKLFAFLPCVRILCIGGDGTVGWIMSCLDMIADEYKEMGTPWTAPPVAVIPLGTGNDLARCLDWGGGFGAWRQKGPVGMLQAVLRSQMAYLDRWTLDINPLASRNGIQIISGNKENGIGASLIRPLISSYRTKVPHRQESAKPANQLAMNNYLGVGVDAKVAFEFHELREAYPQWFQSQFGNKLMYTGVGALDIVGQLSGAEQLDLPSKMEILCDGVPVQLPRGCEGVLLVNIPSYMGGVDLWASSTGHTTSCNAGKQSMSDGMLEIVAVYGSWHLGRLTVGLSKALRLTQGRKVEITTLDTLPMQVDGEPFIQQPAKINVSLRGQARVLRHAKELSKSRMMKTLEAALEAATDEGVISPSQHELLSRDLTSRLRNTNADADTDTDNVI